MDCEVPVEHGAGGDVPDVDIVEVPLGLAFECERLIAALGEALLPQLAAGAAAIEEIDAKVVLIEAVRERLEAAAEKAAAKENNEDDEEEEEEESTPLPMMRLPWIDLAALAQLTYWYDRRPRGDAAEEPSSVPAAEEVRPTEARFGRWTKKVSRTKVMYGTVALRYRTRGHLGERVFRRPAGVDVTRLSTLRRAAALCGHSDLLGLVEETMEQLRPKNVAKIPWEEVQKHNTKDDCWLLIDSKVYDVTPFLGLHPGGGQLIVDAAGHEATSKFEMTHGEGLRYSLRLLNQFFIGDCEGHEAAPIAEPNLSPTPEFLATLRSITGALHTFDEAKATGEAQGILR